VQKVLYAIGAAIVLFVIVGLALPREARVETGFEIDAHPATVFALINDFRRMRLWAPFTASDPNARVVYSGPARGEGATVTWDGSIVGTGSESIVLSQPFERIETVIKVGSESASGSTFLLTEGDGKTTVDWTYTTDYGYNLVGRIIALFLEDAIRRDHEKGLANLRELAESLPRADFSDIEIEHIVVEAQTIAYLPTTSLPEPSAISEAMGDAYFRILSFIDAEGLSEAGAPMSITRSFSGGQLMFDAAIPVKGVGDGTPREENGVRIGTTYAGPVIRVKHVGSYRRLGVTHGKIAAYLAALGIERAGPAWESYVSDPTKVPERELLTYVYYPIRPST
jgi:effector-binding domain-containing protein